MSDTSFKVCGAGLPRTGTASLQKALEILGYGPVMHMFECFKSPDLSKQWLAYFNARADFSAGTRAEKPDFKYLLEGYNSGVDAPVSELFLDIAKDDPNVKIVLTHRPADEWMKSINSTIMRVTEPAFGFLVYWVPESYWQRRMALEGLFPLFRERYGGKGLHEGTMQMRIDEAKANIPADRLLIFRVQEGWEPLCKFLSVPIPSVPFPRVNDTAALEAFMLSKIKKGAFRWLLVLAGVVGTASMIIPHLRLEAWRR